ncbi:MAG: Unknown protein [uncultured Thiotrichaceae bacterium]|uniref:Uncharacterized protein n=1 Tax=uncultured Thiotrichaceae bacterium TaxID=298394 RepID=A0A6S6SZB3_9GAMM|nr:MAG: Unknown protein [uncultured Thiotrichaceae bacterium]
MKVRNLSAIAALTLMMGFAHAAPLTPNEVFAAIDGETEYAGEVTMKDVSSERVNFSIAPIHDGERSAMSDKHSFWDEPGLVGTYD